MADGSLAVRAGRRRSFDRLFVHAMAVGSRPNNLLRFALGVLALAMTVIAFVSILAATRPYGIDLEIPLRAAQRWIDGGQPYLASSFGQPPGPDLPFLYPPVVLPLVAPLLALPRPVVLDAWCLACLAAAVWSSRRLGASWLLVPAFVMWPPFSEGIIGGNVQVVLFACYVALFFAPVRGAAASTSGHRTDSLLDPRPVLRDPSDRSTPAIREGVLATLVAALKVAQLHPWVWLLAHRWRAAVLGAAIALGTVLVALPFTGIGIWFDWLAQVRRAADPHWLLAGIALGRYVPAVVALAVTVVTIVALAKVPGRRAGTWVGLLSVLGAPSLHTYGLLFMLPAALRIRRELALFAAFWISTFTEPGFWIGIAIVAGAFVVGDLWWPALLEPEAASRRAGVATAATPSSLEAAPA